MADTEEQAEAQDQAGTQEKKEMRLEMRMDAERYQRIKRMARYAAVEGLIPDNHRGNITDWVNYCLNIGDELLTNHAQKKRGF